MKVIFNKNIIEFTWTKKPIKNMYIRINHEGEITVSSPMRTSEEKIKAFVLSKANWIEKKQSEKIQLDENSMIILGKQMLRTEIYPQSETEYIKTVAEQVLPNRFSFYNDLIGKQTTMQIKDMKGKYGYCVPSKNLVVLNTRLVIASPACIDYVILHELMHLFVFSHDKSFHDLVKKYLPNEKELRAELRKYPV